MITYRNIPIGLSLQSRRFARATRSKKRAHTAREKKNSNYRGDIKATHARAPSILTTKPLTIYYY